MKDAVLLIKFIAIFFGIAIFGAMLDSTERDYGLSDSIVWSYILYPTIVVIIFGFIFLAIRYSQDKKSLDRATQENSRLMEELRKKDEENPRIKRESLKDSVARLNKQKREYEKTRTYSPSGE